MIAANHTANRAILAPPVSREGAACLADDRLSLTSQLRRVDEQITDYRLTIEVNSEALRTALVRRSHLADKLDRFTAPTDL